MPISADSRVYATCAAIRLRWASFSPNTTSLSGMSATPPDTVTESTLRAVSAGIAVVTAGFSQSDAPPSRARISTEARPAGLCTVGR